jgi:hypothetical protein
MFRTILGSDQTNSVENTEINKQSHVKFVQELTCTAASGEVSSAIKLLLVIKSSRMVSLSLMLACGSRYANET